MEKFKINDKDLVQLELILLDVRIIDKELIKIEEYIAEKIFKSEGYLVLKYPFNESNGNFKCLCSYLGNEKAIGLKALKIGFLDFFMFRNSDKIEMFFLECKGYNSFLTENQLNFIRCAKNLGIECKVLVLVNFQEDS